MKCWHQKLLVKEPEKNLNDIVFAHPKWHMPNHLIMLASVSRKKQNLCMSANFKLHT